MKFDGYEQRTKRYGTLASTFSQEETWPYSFLISIMEWNICSHSSKLIFFRFQPLFYAYAPFEERNSDDDDDIFGFIDKF